MSEERAYFKVEPDSPLVAVRATAEAQRRAFVDAMKAIGREFGTDDVYVVGHAQFSGLGLRDPLPAGFKRRKDGVCVPDKRTKDGRALAKRFDALPIGVGPWEFARMLNTELKQDFMFWGAERVYFPTLTEIGDHLIFSVDARCNQVPPRCTRLKMSEYWALREAHAEAA